MGEWARELAEVWWGLRVAVVSDYGQSAAYG